jgi:formylglycine-generating enzyme required for sulfatase activity
MALALSAGCIVLDAHAQKVGSKFRDCDACPFMTVVPAGKYRMGDLTGTGLHNETPAHDVIIPRAFAVGIYEIAYLEFDACVADGGCKHKPNDANWGRGKRAVASVSWNDAGQYVDWLSKKTGKKYRLLTEAEWEYAARAGTKTRYPWGDELGQGNAACLSCGAGSVMTLQAGQLPPNAFGLHDMVASRKEWVQDCWNSSYAGAPSDGSAWLQGQCKRRVLRGGSWYDSARFIRSASRAGAVLQEREDQYGFRVAREIAP